MMIEPPESIGQPPAATSGECSINLVLEDLEATPAVWNESFAVPCTNLLLSSSLDRLYIA